MGVRSRIPATIAWVVVAFVIAWAPLFHAICIAPAQSVAAVLSSTHVMADGTVMGGAALSNGPAHSGHGSSSEPQDAPSVEGLPSAALATVGPSSEFLDPADLIGAVVIVAGLAMLTLVFGCARRLLPSRSDPPRRLTVRPTWRDILSARWADVDLDALGISRT